MGFFLISINVEVVADKDVGKISNIVESLIRQYVKSTMDGHHHNKIYSYHRELHIDF